MLRKRTTVTALAVGICCLGVGRAAADGYEGGSVKDAPVAAESYIWDGLYAGVGIGVGSFDHDLDVGAHWKKLKQVKWCDYADKFCSLSYPVNYGKGYDSFGDDDWDVFGTIQLGYDRVLHERFLIGAFTDFDFYHDSEKSYELDLYNWWGKAGSIAGSVELEHMWNVGGRLGILVTPRVLIYGVGGYSQADIELALHKGNLSLSSSEDIDGYFVGGGGEVKLTKNLSLKFEYRWTDLDSLSVSGSGKYTSPWKDSCYGKCEVRYIESVKAHADLDADVHSVRANLVMKFGEPDHVAPAPLK